MFARLKVGAAPKNGRARRVYLQVVVSTRSPVIGQREGRVTQRVVATLGRVDRLPAAVQDNLRVTLSGVLANIEPCKLQAKG